VAARANKPSIYVLAGVNGAGKSSLLGSMFREAGGLYFNPDEATSRILAANPGISRDAANSAAWHEGRRLLERAIANRDDFAFETTLGGQTIAGLLEQAISKGIEVRIDYVGLEGVELHVARVRARVKRGGHEIAEEFVRQRYDRSRLNLIRLLPRLSELRLYDNSSEADPSAGITPEPILVLHCINGSVVGPGDLPRTPEWAKPIVAAAIRHSTSLRGRGRRPRRRREP
jgi:predicted ABC-type ATPase